MATPNGFQFALEHATTPGLVVVVVLCLLSALSWTVLLTKFSVLRQAQRRNDEYLQMFRKMRHPLEIYEQGLDRLGTPLYSVYAAGARELCLQMLGTSERDDTFALRLRNAECIAPTQVPAITLSMERAVGEMALRLEKRMNLLATCVSGAPFIGLLGTVWSVMDTFAAIASAPDGATIQNMAPGVASALVTTVFGLLVAIPAMFGYNYLIQSIKTMVMLLDHHASELAAAYERHYVDHGLTPQQPAPPPVLAGGPVPSWDKPDIFAAAGPVLSGFEADEDDDAVPQPLPATPATDADLFSDDDDTAPGGTAPMPSPQAAPSAP
jgi:biopolymer transport protein ExbB/TolQ